MAEIAPVPDARRSEHSKEDKPQKSLGRKITACALAIVLAVGLVMPICAIWPAPARAEGSPLLHILANGELTIEPKDTIMPAAGLALLLRLVWVEPVRVDGNSMLNTLTSGEVMITTKWNSINNLARFDVVACKFPGRNEIFIKRIIGLPGETMEIRDGELYINGEWVDQPFDLMRDIYDFPSDAYSNKNTVVPPDHYFVMGDNRNNSNDSRNIVIGALPRSMMKGHVRFVIFPFDKIRVISDYSSEER